MIHRRDAKSQRTIFNSPPLRLRGEKNITPNLYTTPNVYIPETNKNVTLSVVEGQ
jgi:hypothetical protein